MDGEGVRLADVGGSGTAEQLLTLTRCQPVPG